MTQEKNVSKVLPTPHCHGRQSSGLLQCDQICQNVVNFKSLLQCFRVFGISFNLLGAIFCYWAIIPIL